MKEERRTIIKRLRLNKKEDQMLKKKSKLCGLNESTFLRLLICDYVPKERPAEEFYVGIRTVSNGINSLEQFLRENRQYDIAYEDDMRQLIEQLRTLMNDMYETHLFPETIKNLGVDFGKKDKV